MIHVSCCPTVNAACQRRALLSAGISIFLFYTFQNVFAGILWHFSQSHRSVEMLVNLLTQLRISK